jgi:uncharacterized membrane protein YjgN (DUF898 family)
MTFHFEAGYRDALKVLYAWGILPAFVLGLIFEGFGHPFIMGSVSLVFSISLPWLICRIKKVIVEHTRYGGKKGSFTARGSQFFMIYLVAGVVMLAVTIPVGIGFGVATVSSQKLSWFGYIVPLATYIGYVFSYAYIRAKSTNLVWQHTRLGPLTFKATMQFRKLAFLYLTNALGIIVSLGLLTPWAVIRTFRYRAEHLEVKLHGTFNEFLGGNQDEVDAVGAEATDLFDWDFSI